MATAADSPNERTMVLYGADDFSRRELIRRQVADLGEEAAFNVATLDGEGLTPEALLAAAATPPFLGSRRLVVVNALLSRFQASGERGRRAEPPSLGAWAGLPAQVQSLPSTTTLIFNEGTVAASNPLMRLLRPVATVREFRPLRGPALLRWVLDRALRLGSTLPEPAAQALIAIAGEDLWVLKGELEKLSLFAEGHPITEATVRLLASGAREANVFEMVDAVLAHRRADALRLLHDLLVQGAAPALLLFLIGRQLRLLIGAVELLGTPTDEAQRRLGLNAAWQAERALRQARQLGREALLAAHGRLIEADLDMKTGRYSSELTLELLVIDLSGAALSRR